MKAIVIRMLARVDRLVRGAIRKGFLKFKCPHDWSPVKSSLKKFNILQAKDTLIYQNTVWKIY